MVSIRMIAFSKNSNCPSSEKLLAFQKGEARISVSEHIRRHLVECEFCSAEIELYSRHQPAAHEPVRKTDIPPSLRELAEALLSHKHRDFKSLNKLMNEKERRNLVKF